MHPAFLDEHWLVACRDRRYKDLMRADFCCFDEYTHTRSSEPPLAVPMTTFYATRDRKITAAMVRQPTASSQALMV